MAAMDAPGGEQMNLTAMIGTEVAVLRIRDDTINRDGTNGSNVHIPRPKPGQITDEPPKHATDAEFRHNHETYCSETQLHSTEY